MTWRALALLLCCPLASAQQAAGNYHAHSGHEMAEDPQITSLLADRLEAQPHAGSAVAAWDVRLWTGTDRSRWQLRSEGHQGGGSDPTDATWDLSWGRPVTAWMTASVGLVADREMGRGHSGVQLGLDGVLPYRVHLQSGLWLMSGGGAALRIELEHDLLVTQHLVMQPRVESRLWTDGSRSAQLGLRLRYELRRELAPYLGVSRQWIAPSSFGMPSSRADDGWQAVLGVRAWF